MSGKKNRRRSSLAPIRVSMVTKETSSDKELRKLIDPDLSRETRLVKLTSFCLQHTLENMDTADCPHYDWFKSTAQEKISCLISKLQEDGVFEQASQKDRLLPNPVNAYMDAEIAETELNILRLESENKKWDDVYNELDEKVQQAEIEKEKKEIRASEITDRVKIESRDYYSQNADYNAVVNDVQQHVNKAVLSMEESCNLVNLLQRTHKNMETKLQTQCDQFWKESFKDVETPRKQIKNRLSVPIHNSDHQMNGEI